MELGARLQPQVGPLDSEEAEYMRRVNFPSAVGTLMHIAVQTRPDIAKAVQNVAQYMSNPNKTHWNAVKRIFQYLKSTRDYVLTVGGDGPREPEAWCDASHADQPKVKSTSGYAIFIGQGCIAWSAKKQTIVALSTTEAEFYAAEHCGREIIWLRQLFQEIGLMPVRKPAPTLHHMDSSTAIKKLTTPDEVNNRTKHVDIAYY